MTDSETPKQEWQVYVWLDKNGEPRSIQTVGEKQEGHGRHDATFYPPLPVDAGVSGYPPRGDALFWARPFSVYNSPIPGQPGLIFLCSIVSAEGNEQLSGQSDSLGALGDAAEPLEHIKLFEVVQQFYLTTKFVPISFATNPPAKPGPFGSGVGADLAVGRATVMRAVNWLGAAGGSVASVAPLATPSHWGVGIWVAEPTRGVVRVLADHIMLFRYLLGRACEDSNMTPAFISQLLKEQWPPSVLQIVVKSVSEDKVALAKRLQPSHETLMRALTPPRAAVGGGPAPLQEVEPYVWADNSKGPVTVASHNGRTWLYDNRLPSAANPHIALAAWAKGWIGQ